MRDYEPDLICYGTNPNVKTHICSISIPLVLTSNCATVEEAVKYLQESLDIYTLIDGSAASGWNLCYMMGDVTGKYGLVEIAKDEIHFLPLQHGQANYYLTPTINAISKNQCGYGRHQFGLEYIDKVQNDEEMLALMESIMWRNEILNIPCACQNEAGKVCFCEDVEHTIPSLDWRSDNIYKIPVNKFGHYFDISANTTEAKLVRLLKKGYDDYSAGIETKKNLKNYNLYEEYIKRCNLNWAQNDSNFTELQKG